MRLYGKVIAYALKGLGVLALLKSTHKSQLLIVTYHGVLPDKLYQGDSPLREYEYRNFMNVSDFEEQIRYFRTHYHPIMLKEYLQYRKEGKELPPYSVIVTFDDGFLNNYEYAFPILKKYDVPAVFFVSTAFIGNQKMLWTEELIYRLTHTQKKQLNVQILGKEQQFFLETVRQKQLVASRIRQQLKRVPRKEVERFMQQMQEQLDDVSLDFTSVEDQLRYHFMDWHHLKEMIANGMEVGSHTHNHLILSQLSEQESRFELKTSRDLIEKNLGIVCYGFSYPNGKRTDFSERDKKILRDLGYLCATTQEPGWNDDNMDLFELKRINISHKAVGIAFETVLAIPTQKFRTGARA